MLEMYNGNLTLFALNPGIFWALSSLSKSHLCPNSIVIENCQIHVSPRDIALKWTGRRSRIYHNFSPTRRLPRTFTRRILENHGAHEWTQAFASLCRDRGARGRRGILSTTAQQCWSRSTFVTSQSLQLLTRHQRKRVRLSALEEPSDNESEQSDTLADYNEPQPPSPVGNNVAEYEEDEDDYDDYDDEEAVQRAMDSMRHRNDVENHAADNGIVEEIICSNFMCHANLRVAIGANINFIIGHNGSGKSAVLTALQICLGGKATSTNRGQSLKAFIKAGTDHCNLSVKIKNQGDNAYQHDVYGDSIIVERFFSKNGPSGYKLKNAHGRIISTKKSDLEDITDAMALQMDNPMNVLTQDMARQFLNSSNATEKYKFFYKGTHLEQLDSDYKILAESLQSNNEQSYNLKDSLAEAQKMYAAAEKKVKLSERAGVLEHQITRYSSMMAWVQVEEQEKLLADIERDCRAHKEGLQKYKDEAEEQDGLLERADEAIVNTGRVVQDLKSEREPKQMELEEAKDVFKKGINELEDLQAQGRQINGEKTTAEKQIKTLEDKITEEQTKIADADDGMHAQKLEEIQDAKAKLESLRADAIARSSQSRKLDVEKDKAYKQMDTVKSAKEAKANDINNTERRLRTLESGTGDWMNAYHDSLRPLLQAIDRETRFREKPIGPFGRYVSLLKPRWSNILESSSGAVLNAFAVTTAGDQQILSGLMKRCSYRGAVIVTDANRIDTSRNEPPAHLDTWLRVLKFDSDLVRKAMIINQGIDGTVLEEDNEKATGLLELNDKSIKQIFTFRRNNTGERLAKTQSGAHNASPITAYRGAARMQTDKGSQIA